MSRDRPRPGHERGNLRVLIHAVVTRVSMRNEQCRVRQGRYANSCKYDWQSAASNLAECAERLMPYGTANDTLPCVSNGKIVPYLCYRYTRSFRYFVPVYSLKWLRSRNCENSASQSVASLCSRYLGYFYSGSDRIPICPLNGYRMRYKKYAVFFVISSIRDDLN